MKSIKTMISKNDLRLLQAVRDAKFNEVADFVGYLHATKGGKRETLEVETNVAFDAVCLVKLLDRLIAGAKDVDESEQPF